MLDQAGIEMAKSVFEINPRNKFGQAVLASELSSFVLRRQHQLERHNLTSFSVETPLGALRRAVA